MKARYAQQKKEEKDYAQCEQANDEEYRETQLLRDLRVRNLLLRLREERVPLPGTQLPVWLQKTRYCTVIAKAYCPP